MHPVNVDRLADLQYVIGVGCIRYEYLITFWHEDAPKDGGNYEDYGDVEDYEAGTIVCKDVR